MKTKTTLFLFTLITLFSFNTYADNVPVWMGRCRATGDKLAEHTERLVAKGINVLDTHVRNEGNSEIACSKQEKLVGILIFSDTVVKAKAEGYQPLSKDPLLDNNRVH